MRRLAFLPVLLLLVLAGRPAVAQQATPDTGAWMVAHGAAEQTREMWNTSHSEHGTSERNSYFGIPVWIWKLANMVLFLGLLGYLLRKPLATSFDQRAAGSEQILPPPPKDVRGRTNFQRTSRPGSRISKRKWARFSSGPAKKGHDNATSSSLPRKRTPGRFWRRPGTKSMSV